MPKIQTYTHSCRIYTAYIPHATCLNKRRSQRTAQYNDWVTKSIARMSLSARNARTRIRCVVVAFRAWQLEAIIGSVQNVERKNEKKKRNKQTTERKKEERIEQGPHLNTTISSIPNPSPKRYTCRRCQNINTYKVCVSVYKGLLFTTACSWVVDDIIIYRSWAWRRCLCTGIVMRDAHTTCCSTSAGSSVYPMTMSSDRMFERIANVEDGKRETTHNKYLRRDIHTINNTHTHTHTYSQNWIKKNNNFPITQHFSTRVKCVSNITWHTCRHITHTHGCRTRTPENGKFDANKLRAALNDKTAKTVPHVAFTVAKINFILLSLWMARRRNGIEIDVADKNMSGWKVLDCFLIVDGVRRTSYVYVPMTNCRTLFLGHMRARHLKWKRRTEWMPTIIR